MKNVYKVIQKASGAVGGYGHNGPVYGELTMGTFQKVINFLTENLDFGPDSCFMDIGSGLGKPNLHVAVSPGVRYSFGVELEDLRWKLSMHNLRHCVSACPSIKAVEEQHQHPNVFFAKADITSLDNFEPFTHIYMFDVGFPPNVLVQIANSFNVSRTAKALISFTKPLHIIKTYGFAVKLVGKIATRMCGSSEGHTAYIYESLHNPAAPASAPTADTTPLQPVDDDAETDPAKDDDDNTTSRVMRRSPSKRKRRRQLQMDKIYKRERRGTRKLETPGKAQPKELFPVFKNSEHKKLSVIEDGMDILKLPSSDSKSRFSAWLESTGRLETPGRPKRPSARKVLSYKC